MLLVFKIGVILISLVVLYFFLVTRGSLIIKKLLFNDDKAFHIYWVYSNSFLIWLTDRSFIVSTILFFNYHRLAETVLQRLNPSMEGKLVLQASCAFGNISKKIMEKCIQEGATQVIISDLIANEIKHTKRKLKYGNVHHNCSYLLEDALAMAHKDESFDYVIIFFLFHELPYEKKVTSLNEAMRVLKPGGKLIFAEYHKPTSLILKISGRCFFKVFEPFAVEMWETFDALQVLHEDPGHRWQVSKNTFFSGNYQVFTAEKSL
ncbi:MAG: class I SAM-dependent methyltransferase [Deltaproteobacteria bacterium]|nr:class I SAM-dependent methyltransferase [Deltaproteobacteria bacterium]